MKRAQVNTLSFESACCLRESNAPECVQIAGMRSEMEALRRRNAQLQEALVELTRLAGTDKLTGAWNRRRLEEAVGREMDRMKRYGHSLSLAILDVDHFKRVNDGHGHAVGDQLLLGLSERIVSVLRAADSLTRWGGEEFVVLCPDTGLRQAAQFAERLRRTVASARFPIAEPVTISVGVAECMPQESWEHWFRRADAALLGAKASGRNQVMTSPEIAGPVAGAVRSDPGLVRLLWDSGFASGEDAVDQAHRKLFVDINALLSAVLAGAESREIGALAQTLIDDVAQHFRDEEALLSQIGYPRAAKHAATHQILLGRAHALLERFGQSDAEVGELFQFLAHDLVVKHMLATDTDFFPHLARRRACASGSAL